MDCRETRESILDAMVEAVAHEARIAMENHITTCPACARFAEIQRALDIRLTAAAPPSQLSPQFRSALKERIRRDPLTAWPDSLPDIAHLIGCVIAIVLSILLLPLRPETVLLTGLAVTVVTYVLQAALRTSLDGFE